MMDEDNELDKSASMMAGGDQPKKGGFLSGLFNTFSEKKTSITSKVKGFF